MTRPKIEVHIGELVLHGFRHADRHAIGDALAGELARALAAAPLPPSLAKTARVPSLDAGSVRVAPAAAPKAIGAQVAARVAGGLAGGGKR
ncbi:MAG TPA: hypothetical protein VFF06_19985 [Polyangia bacterium]|nr:hypothetical protein [Polyangia bacterium]